MKNKKLKIKNKGFVKKFKKGDEVIVTLGKDKGKKGKIEKLFVKDGKALILGVNEFKRHIKGRTSKKDSEIKTITKPISLSKVAIVCPKCALPTRIGMVIKDGKKNRICKKCKKEI